MAMSCKKRMSYSIKFTTKIQARGSYAPFTASQVNPILSGSCLCSGMWGMRAYIHINLCVCLIISQVTFISAVDKTAMEKLCQAIAIVLHYFFLTTFMWMLMEGVVLYVVLVRVFIKQQYLYMIGFTVVSYGLPALYVFCVTVPLGLTIRDSEGRPQYGSSNSSDTCWLRYDTHFIWAFITPVLVIIITNIGFLSMAISIMWKHEMRGGTEKSKFKSVRHWLKAIIALMVVMGITWSIGVLVFHRSLIFVAYIFAIGMSLQGTFIFILYVALSKQVKDQYRSWWRSKKGESEFLSKLFSSEISGWNKSSKELRSDSSSVTKDKTLQTQTMDKSGAAAGVQLTSLPMVDRNQGVSTFEGAIDNYYDKPSNMSNMSNDPEKENGNFPEKGIDDQSSSKGNDDSTIMEKHNHMTRDRSCVQDARPAILTKMELICDK